MTSKIKAINQYRPRIVLDRRAEMPDLVEFISRSTELNESTIQQVFTGLRDTVVFFNLRGQPVKLDGLGTYAPSIDLNGKFSVAHRADNHLMNAYNTPNRFQGEIANRENIGKSSDDLVNL